jgi:hypothetical protein
MSDNLQEGRLVSLGRTLIRWRVAALAVIAVLTAFFGYHAAQLRLQSRFDELLPSTHPFIAVHRQFAQTFGGANTALIMLRVRQGDIFNIKTLDKIWSMTQELDKIYGVNHYQIESLAHRTNRTLRVSAGGLMEMQPVMMGGAKTQADVDKVRRIVHARRTSTGSGVDRQSRGADSRELENIIDQRKLFGRSRPASSSLRRREHGDSSPASRSSTGGSTSTRGGVLDFWRLGRRMRSCTSTSRLEGRFGRPSPA